LVSKMFRVAFDAIGCKLNQYEIQAIAEALEPYGMTRVGFDEYADIYVVNTCTVTGRADADSRNSIRRARRRNPEAKIIATGCLAELNPSLLKSLDKFALVAGNSMKQDIPKLVVDMIGGKWSPREVENSISRMDGHSRAFVKIQDGCADGCSYCTIWRARGKPRSRSHSSIIKEINALFEHGYREVILTGVHIGKYRHDFGLAGLLERIIKETPMPRLRLSSLKPNEITPALLRLYAEQERICPHLHLSIQSGSERILSLMGRGYTSSKIESVIERAIRARPDTTIGADMMVGFPGETATDFGESLKLVENLPIHLLHVFSYSDRPGTPASEFPDKVAPAVMRTRHSVVVRVGEKKQAEHLRRFIGKRLEVVVESRSEGGMVFGTSRNYLKVKFRAGALAERSLAEVVIIGVENKTLHGEVTACFNKK